MPKKGTEDWIKDLIEETETEVVGPEGFQTILDKYMKPAQTEEGRQRIREVIEREVFPEVIDSLKENIRQYWKTEEEHPEYYRSRAEDYLQYVFENWETHPGPEEVAEALGISESYAKYLRWLIRRAGFEV